MIKKVIIIFALSIFISAMATKPDITRNAIDKYVKTMIPTCTLSDGYQCNDIQEDDFLSKKSLDKLISAQYLQAWDSAYNTFSKLPELSIEQRHLKHYKIGFTESSDDYIVLFMPLLMPESIANGKPVGYATTTFGKTVKFWIDKKSFKVTKHLFYK